jgi:hypothetical protein
VSEPVSLTDLQIALARIEERQKSAVEAAEHRHNNTKMILEGLASKKDVQAIDERVANLERNQGFVIKGIVGVVGVSIASLMGLGKKLGL